MTIAENVCADSKYDRERLYHHLIKQEYWTRLKTYRKKKTVL